MLESNNRSPETFGRHAARIAHRMAIVVAIGAFGAVSVSWADSAEAPRDLSGMRLEDLMNLEITSASKHEQRLGEVAAAISVLDGETIRRSGVTSIPEALRLVPGLIVQRIDGNKWAVASRGFAYRWSNSLLVLIDGRSVYSPMFSGVYWDAQDVVLEDIDRIEVIRGPGATVWGANAVTGVINIITKHASETHGLLASATTGQREPFVGTLRWGGSPTPGLDVRAFVRGTRRDASERPASVGGFGQSVPLSSDGTIPGNDRSHLIHTGVRADWKPNDLDAFTFQGDSYLGESDWTVPVPSFTAPYVQLNADRTRIENAYGLARWKRDLHEAGDLTVQAYFDKLERPDTRFLDQNWTADLDVQHHVRFGDRHEVVWGGGARWIKDRLGSGYFFGMQPEARERVLWSLFAQDEVSLVPSRLRWTIGAKFEDHTYTGVEVQPTTRLLWSPSEHNSAWASWSRAVRAPARGDRDANLIVAAAPGPGIPVLVLVKGGGDGFKSEVLQAWEAGWRAMPLHAVTLDAAVFLNFHTGLRASVGEALPTFDPAPQPHLVATQYLVNGHDVRAHGLEVSATWTPRTSALLQMSGTWYTSRFSVTRGQPSSLNVTADQGTCPAFQGLARLALDLPHQLDCDIIVRRVGELPSGFVPAYQTLDVRTGWHPTAAARLDIVVRDAFETGRFESNYPGSLAVPTLASRSFEARLTLLAK